MITLYVYYYKFSCEFSCKGVKRICKKNFFFIILSKKFYWHIIIFYKIIKFVSIFYKICCKKYFIQNIL